MKTAGPTALASNKGGSGWGVEQAGLAQEADVDPGAGIGMALPMVTDPGVSGLSEQWPSRLSGLTERVV